LAVAGVLDTLHMLLNTFDAGLVRLKTHARGNTLIKVVGMRLALVALLLGTICFALAHGSALLALRVVAPSRWDKEQGEHENA